MEHEVRYCTTDDGVRIAYTVSGTGPPLLFTTEPVVSHVELEWSQPVFRRLYSRLASGTTLIRFDPRGTGLSDRVLPLTLDESVLDMEAVVRRLALPELALAAVQSSSQEAIVFAARWKQAVRHLVLLDGFLRATDVLNTQQIRALAAAARVDFVLATEAIGAAAFGVGRDESRDYGAYIRMCVAPEYFSNPNAAGAFDATSSAPRVSAPTLVVKHAGLQYSTMEMARELASSIPNARLATVDGMWGDNIEALADRIIEFVNEDYVAPDRYLKSGTKGVRTVLFTDIVGHTEMMQRLGDDRGRDVLREHERITRETLKQHGGAEVKTMGDGFMASFGSVTSAMDCAIALQRAFAAWNEQVGAQPAAPTGEPLHVRVGLNAGEPIEEEGDLFGSTVIMASRIAAKAGAGEILIPEPLRHLLSGKSYVYADRGETMLKGFEDAVRLYEVRWRE